MKNLLILALLSFAPTINAQNVPLDSTFGINGAVVAEFDKEVTAYQVKIQPTGKIIVIVSLNREARQFIVRYKLNGSIDSTFGVSGRVDLDTFIMAASEIQPDGKILIAGYMPSQSGTGVGVLRLLPDGAIDNRFGNNGFVFTPLTHAYIYTLTVQSDGKIIIAGGFRTQVTMPSEVLILRYFADGALDHSFGIGGKVISNATPESEYASAVTTQSDGKIVIGGSYGDFRRLFMVLRYLPNGDLDNSFGVRITEMPCNQADIHTIWAHPNGKITAIGSSYIQAQVPLDFIALARYKPNGDLDEYFTGYNTGLGMGFRNIRLTLGGSNGAALQSDGKIVLTGGEQFMRLTAEGTGDTTFRSIVYRSQLFMTRHVAIQRDGKIIVLGHYYNRNKQHFVMFRYFSGLEVGTIDFSMVNEVQIAPNPVERQTILRYNLLDDTHLSIQLLNMQGQLITVFKNQEPQSKGAHEESFLLPETLPAGTYLIRMLSPKGQKSIQIVKM